MPPCFLNFPTLLPATMEHCEKADIWVEKDGDSVYDHMKYILKSGKEHEEEYFYAIVYERVGLDATPDPRELDTVPIPAEHIWPLFPSSLTRAPDPLPEGCYVKRPSLLDYEVDKSEHGTPELVLEEAEIYEILSKNPHPNIAKYLGCKVVDGKIRGLCLERYVMTLEARVETKTPFDKDLFLKGIKDGIRHLHSLGFTHNDINPYNVMMTADDQPVIIDFDSCKRTGQELVKCGTPNWGMKDARYATQQNDIYGFDRLEEYLDKHFGKRHSEHEGGGVDFHATSSTEAGS
ncbi:kinase-like domain-containing protein [Trichoderma chlorosporum]